jgi:hypothetical protein
MHMHSRLGRSGVRREMFHVEQNQNSIATQVALDELNVCLPIKRAACTKPASNKAGFVAAIPSRVFRDGMGICRVMLNQLEIYFIYSARIHRLVGQSG